MISTAALLATSLALTAPGEPAPAAPAAADSPDARIHAVEPRGRTEAGRHELTVYPLTAQLNASWSKHFGVALAYAWHVTERLAVQATPFFNYVSGESGFQRELVDKASVQADAATALLMRWGGTAGVELSPIDGKFAFGQGFLGRFSLALSLGVGAASTRVQLSDDGYGDVGARFVGSVGIAARIALGDRVALRLEVRDLVTTARVGRIEGCSREDLAARSAGGKASGSCHADHLSDVEENNARLLLEDSSSSVLNHVSFMLGVGVLF